MTQKKTQIGLLAAILLGGIFTSCMNKGDKVIVADNETEVVVDTFNTLPPFKYPGREPHIAAVYTYLIDSIGAQYSQGDICIPQVTIVKTDETNSNDILVWGDFWVFNYKQVGDTLKTVSGGNDPGLMHVKQVGKTAQVTKFERVEDGAGNVASAKKIFGINYSLYRKLCSEQERDKVRAEGIADYVKRNKLSITCFQDYGWDAVSIQK
jgi:hypothetical protein